MDSFKWQSDPSKNIYDICNNFIEPVVLNYIDKIYLSIHEQPHCDITDDQNLGDPKIKEKNKLTFEQYKPLNSNKKLSYENNL